VTTAAERKAAQRARDRAAGLTEILVKVHVNDVGKIRRLAKTLLERRKG